MLAGSDSYGSSHLSEAGSGSGTIGKLSARGADERFAQRSLPSSLPQSPIRSVSHSNASMGQRIVRLFSRRQKSESKHGLAAVVALIEDPQTISRPQVLRALFQTRLQHATTVVTTANRATLCAEASDDKVPL
jgi:hypothetical protein